MIIHSYRIQLQIENFCFYYSFKGSILSTKNWFLPTVGKFILMIDFFIISLLTPSDEIKNDCLFHMFLNNLLLIRSIFKVKTRQTPNIKPKISGGSMGDADAAFNYNRERRRSSFARPMRDQEEILETLRSLKAQGRGELSRTMSLSGEKKRPNRKYSPVVLS